MNQLAEECCILNSGSGSWAFEPLALRLSSVLGVDIVNEPRRFNYVLYVEDTGILHGCGTFISLDSVRLASDKRLLATAFAEHGVPTPITHLLPTFAEVRSHVAEHSSTEWCLKYPTSCGANGHRLVTANTEEPANWPTPFILQEFIRLERPEVYRTYCAGGELFGWVTRRFPEGTQSSPWVAHARGARYVVLGAPPVEAVEPARRALAATGLLNSFGCVDLLRRPTGEWVVLEVGTDGIFNHVDRELEDIELERELDQRIAKAFWHAAQRRHELPVRPQRRVGGG